MLSPALNMWQGSTHEAMAISAHPNLAPAADCIQDTAREQPCAAMAGPEENTHARLPPSPFACAGIKHALSHHPSLLTVTRFPSHPRHTVCEVGQDLIAFELYEEHDGERVFLAAMQLCFSNRYVAQRAIWPSAFAAVSIYCLSIHSRQQWHLILSRSCINTLH